MACANSHSLRRAAHVEPWVDVVEVDLTVERPDEEVETDRAYQRLGVRIVDQSLAVAQHPLSGHHRRRRPDAGRQIPRILVAACHISYFRIAER
jgi:hypothetical protein